ncbi:hypothetical protein, partial [Escherichia coli]|uniref:hypothetical protein n=1 Tax=Escherichia coli TaxID=562 RepID=UPI001C454748
LALAYRGGIIPCDIRGYFVLLCKTWPAIMLAFLWFIVRSPALQIIFVSVPSHTQHQQYNPDNLTHLLSRH